jgi:hypothetical protein
MIGKAQTRSDFVGLASYLTKDESCVSLVETRNTFEPADRPDQVGKEMRDAAAASERVEQPVYHLRVFWPKEDETTPRERVEAVEEVLEDIGLGDHQALVVGHNDAKPHVHAMVNRVQHDPYEEDYGTAWDTGHDWHKIESSLRKIERERGWRQVPGEIVKTPDVEMEPGEALTNGEMQYFKRTGEMPLLEEVRDWVGEDFEESRSWDELEAGLREHEAWVEETG